MSKEKGFAPLSIILGILVILVIAGGAYYFGTKPAHSPASSPPSTNVVSDWQTYTNLKYKFSIQYPADWVLVPFASEDIIPGLKPKNDENYKDPYHPAFSIREGCYDPEVKKLDFKQWIASSAAGEVQGYTKAKSIEEIIATSGVKGFKVTWGTFIPGGGSGTSQVAYIKLPSPVGNYNCLEFESGGADYSAVKDQILSTFKFTN